MYMYSMIYSIDFIQNPKDNLAFWWDVYYIHKI